MEDITAAFKRLINVELPGKYTYPVRHNHCFNRIILDWLFQGCWYLFIDRRKTALSQLSKDQLQAAVKHMKKWLTDQSLLIGDNHASLKYRRKL